MNNSTQNLCVPKNNCDMKLLKNEVKYLLQQFPSGMKFREFLDEYFEHYGKKLCPEKFNCSNLYNLFISLSDIVNTINCKSVRLNDDLIGDVQHRLVFINTSHLRPTIPTTVQKGDYYECKIEAIYDPSKFWIIIKPKELQIFQIHLKRLYDLEENQIQIAPDHLKTGQICMVKDNASYYRCIVNNTLLLNQKKVRVFCVDYGSIINVNVENVMFMNEFVATVPRFAIRATLAFIQPYKNGDAWSLNDLLHFCSLIGKTMLFAKVCEIEAERAVLHVGLRELCGHHCEYINDILINDRIAKRSQKDAIPKKVTFGKYVGKVRNLHLFPSFEMIEDGKVPKSLNELEIVKNSVPLDILQSNYYEYISNE